MPDPEWGVKDASQHALRPQDVADDTDGPSDEVPLAHAAVSTGIASDGRAAPDGALAAAVSAAGRQDVEGIARLQMDGGFLSSYFINDVERNAVVLEDVAVLLIDQRVASLQPLLPLLEQLAAAGRPLLLVAETIEGDALSTLVMHAVQGSLAACAVNAPSTRMRCGPLLDDIAAFTGATVLREDTVAPWFSACLADLGHARRIEVRRENTVFIGGGGAVPALHQRLSRLRRERASAFSDLRRHALDARIANLLGGEAQRAPRSPAGITMAAGGWSRCDVEPARWPAQATAPALPWQASAACDPRCTQATGSIRGGGDAQQQDIEARYRQHGCHVGTLLIGQGTPGDAAPQRTPAETAALARSALLNAACVATMTLAASGRPTARPEATACVAGWPGD